MAIQNPRPSRTGCALFSTKRKLSPQLYYRGRARRAHRLNGLLRDSVGGPCKLADQPVDVGNRGSDARRRRLRHRAPRAPRAGERTPPSQTVNRRSRASSRTRSSAGSGAPFGLGGVAAERRGDDVGAGGDARRARRRRSRNRPARGGLRHESSRRGRRARRRPGARRARRIEGHDLGAGGDRPRAPPRASA